MIDETLFEAEEKMEKAVPRRPRRARRPAHRTGEPEQLRSDGRRLLRLAHPIPQMASVNIPEARMAVIKPYDAAQLGAIEQVIRDSDLGVNPTNDGTIIRVVFHS